MDSNDKSSAQTPPLRWLYLWMMASIGLAAGVLGTAMYVTWFGHDLLTYERAIRVAQERPARMDADVPRGTWAAGPVIRAVPAASATAASSAHAATLSASKPPVFTVAQSATVRGRSACPAPASAQPASSVNTAAPTCPALHQRAAPRPKPPKLYARIGSAFRRASYRHHGPGYDKTTYSHS
jgi:hypothetical protein